MALTVVAEGAQGFEGDPALARLLARAAAEGGADLVKFQLVYADELALPAYRHYELFRSLEMPEAAWRSVADEAAERRIGLAFDVFGPRSLAAAVSLGAKALKIHSTDFFNHELVRASMATGLDVWFSIGGITLDEVADFLATHRTRRPDQLTLLFGFQAEPTALEDNHLGRFTTLRRMFPDLRLGFMDHAAGDSDAARWLGVLAVPYGVAVLEKHITIERSPALEDSVSALTAADFAVYVRRIRDAEAAVGSGRIEATDVEAQYRRRAVKVVVTRRAMAAGESIDASAVALLRAPVDERATPLVRLADAVGARLKHPVEAGRAIVTEDLA